MKAKQVLIVLSLVFNTSSGPYHYQTGTGREMDTLREETCSTASLRKDMAVKTGNIHYTIPPSMLQFGCG